MRALAVEIVVSGARLVLRRDVLSLRGRWEGWRRGADAPRIALPLHAVDESIDLRKSLRMRGDNYWAERSRVAVMTASPFRPDRPAACLHSKVLTALRSRVRAARDLPLLRPLVARADRLWWARVIRRAGVVDLDYVRAQVGRPLSEAAAVRRYVDGGFREGLRLSPLFVDTAVGDHLPEAWRVPALYAYLVADPRGLQVSPLWDAVAYGTAHPDAWEAPGGPLGHAWRRRETHSLPLGPRSEPAAAPWPVLSRVIVDAADRARRGGEVAPGPAAEPVARELILAVGPEEWDFDESFAEAVAFADAPDQGVAIAVLDDRVEDWMLASVLAAGHPRVRVARRRHDDASAALDELLAGSRAEIVVVRGPNQTLTASDAARLAGRVETLPPDAVVGPVWRDGDGTIAAVGAVADGRFLAGTRSKTSAPSDPRPIWRSRRWRVRRSPPAARASLLLSAVPMRPRTWTGRRSSRSTSRPARGRSPRRRICPGPLRRRRPAEPGGLGARRRRPPAAGASPAARGRPARRRACPRPAVGAAHGRPVGPRAEGWGDTHFARALAAALRRLGQEVVIDAYPARERPTRHLDDVTVALRGPEPLEASDVGTSLLWIISHPDEIGAADVAGFDEVFAASAPWARSTGRALGVAITPLLQCTDATRFFPRGAHAAVASSSSGRRAASSVPPSWSRSARACP